MSLENAPAQLLFLLGRGIGVILRLVQRWRVAAGSPVQIGLVRLRQAAGVHDTGHLVEPHHLEHGQHVGMGSHHLRRHHQPVADRQRQLGQKAQCGGIDIGRFAQIDDHAFQSLNRSHALYLLIQRGTQRQAYITG